ncbi:Clavaminate synthase-like protein [Xylaria cubensis]|nr:Clavaminate synthase-like protein [Xylaria cubensis]
MRRRFQAITPLTRHLEPRRRITPVHYASRHDACRVQPVMVTQGSIGVDEFRLLAWEPAVPVHLRGFHSLPAMKTWFTDPNLEGEPVVFGDKLASSADAIVSYELLTSSSSRDDEYASASLRGFQAWLKGQSTGNKDGHLLLYALIDHLLASVEGDQSRFLQFDAPLSLIIQASRYNQSADNSSSHRITQLYVAQSDIRSLPPALVEDLPVPELVRRAGKGDIYSSSIWLGLQPTYTPLHRDPNPNVFCQLAGSKAVRLLRPRAGLSVFQDVRRRLGILGSSSRLRGSDMMDGPEREELHRAVWVDDDSDSDNAPPEREIWQAVLDPGDALFIPQGWWHSVSSVGREAELNASANWWFR